jgi:hypothetical protein
MTDINALIERIDQLTARVESITQTPQETPTEQSWTPSLPWKDYPKLTAILTTDKNVGYPLPAGCTGYFAADRGRNHFELTKKALAKLSRAYPVPNVPAIVHHSGLDAEFSEESKTVKTTQTVTQLIATKDRLQKANDMQCRVLIPLLDLITQIRNEIGSKNASQEPNDSESHEDSDSSSISSASTIPTPSGIENALGKAEGFVRDTIALNRHSAYVLEHVFRDHIAAGLSFPAGTKSRLAKTPSSDAEKLFGPEVIACLQAEKRDLYTTAVIKRDLKTATVTSKAKQIGTTPSTGYPIRSIQRTGSPFGASRGKSPQRGTFRGQEQRKGPPPSVPRASTIQ